LRTLVDTSFLIRVAELGADLLARVEEKLNTKIVPVVIPNVIEELRSLAKGRGVKAKRAGLALIFCETLKQLDVNVKEEDVDLALIRAAKALGLPVLTSDRGLRKSLRNAGVCAIYVNKKGEVRVEGFIP
jgi:rRNA-processing protein FCF1